MLSFTTLVFITLKLVLSARTAPINDTDIRGFVSNPTGRGTFDILQTCILSLVICVWTSLHLDVPPPTYTPKRVLERKLDWMVITFFAPEIIAFTAISHHSSAKYWMERINSLPQMVEAPCNKWTMTDSFYANMGGYALDFTSSDGSVKLLALDSRDIACLVESQYISLPPCNTRAIMDKSKADSIAKALACLQASWLVASCLARTVQHLPLTTLELSTMAYIFLTIIIYALLWAKPVDVHVPTSVPLLFNPPDHVDIEGTILTLLSRIRDSHSFLGPKVAFDIKQFSGIDGTQISFANPSFFALIILGTLFGGWHCLAWNFFFPTHAELVLWRICATFTTCSIPLLAALSYISIIKLENLKACCGAWAEISIIIFGSVVFFCYWIARTVMVVEMFIDLRRLPAAAFETVSWTDFVPHL